ncbi:BMC domain-containing protein [bacterium]|nr:BMC domain-containing protein [bacterium]
MRIRFIKSPTPNTIALLAQRVSPERRERILGKWDAIGLVQGPLADIFAAADIAEKTANVIVEEIRGICPQHMTMIAIFGDTASVETALKKIQEIEA